MASRGRQRSQVSVAVMLTQVANAKSCSERHPNGLLMLILLKVILTDKMYSRLYKHFSEASTGVPALLPAIINVAKSMRIRVAGAT